MASGVPWRRTESPVRTPRLSSQPPLGILSRAASVTVPLTSTGSPRPPMAAGIPCRRTESPVRTPRLLSQPPLGMLSGAASVTVPPASTGSPHPPMAAGIPWRRTESPVRTQRLLSQPPLEMLSRAASVTVPPASTGSPRPPMASGNSSRRTESPVQASRPSPTASSPSACLPLWGMPSKCHPRNSTNVSQRHTMGSPSVASVLWTPRAPSPGRAISNHHTSLSEMSGSPSVPTSTVNAITPMARGSASTVDSSHDLPDLTAGLTVGTKDSQIQGLSTVRGSLSQSSDVNTASERDCRSARTIDNSQGVPAEAEIKRRQSLNSQWKEAWFQRQERQLLRTIDHGHALPAQVNAIPCGSASTTTASSPDSLYVRQSACANYEDFNLRTAKPPSSSSRLGITREDTGSQIGVQSTKHGGSLGVRHLKTSIGSQSISPRATLQPQSNTPSRNHTHLAGSSTASSNVLEAGRPMQMYSAASFR